MVQRSSLGILFLIVVLAALMCTAQEQSNPLIMVHYMPWYQTPTFHGYWGWHWTMNHFDPNSIDSSGHRSIASHFYPLTGPYDSDDPVILEYQTLLMKVTGIDGVLVDWCGSENELDYGTINTSTLNLFNAVQKANLRFGIVYEDQSITHMIESGDFSAAEAYDHGKTAMKYMESHWFETGNYLRFDNRPVLLVFGPQYFLQSADWDTLFTAIPATPLFYTLDTRLAPVAVGDFPWPPMWKSNSAGILTQDALNSYLASFYQQSASNQYLVTSAFPGFQDIYKEAGVSAGYGTLDPQNGLTFSSTFHQALNHHPAVIQVVTWNDYGEGTIVEPTIQFGYQYLDSIQSVKAGLDTSFHFKRADLLWPMEIMNLRILYKGNSEANASLDRIDSLIASDQRDAAAALLDSLTQTTRVAPLNSRAPSDVALQQNYPNPFNPNTNLQFTIADFQFVSLKVFDMLGREVATLVNAQLKPGNYSVRWDAASMASGLYYCTLRAGAVVETKKMLLLK